MEEVSIKIKTAIDLLKDGKSFIVGDLRLSIGKHNTISIAAWSQYINIKNITKSIALKELEEIKQLFFEMVAFSSDLKNFIIGKRLKFNLYFDDYGKVSIPICSEENGMIKWEINLN